MDDVKKSICIGIGLAVIGALEREMNHRVGREAKDTIYCAAKKKKSFKYSGNSALTGLSKHLSPFFLLLGYANSRHL